MAENATIPTPPVEAPKLRIFKVAGSTIREDASTAGLSVQEMRARLAYQFPEIANATHRATRNAAGEEIVEFLPVAGHKG